MLTQILHNQADYILFLNGLMLSLLGAECLSLMRQGDRQMPWKWLAWFGLMQGLSKWSELLVLSTEDNPAFMIFRVCLTTISFLFLVEFGRVGTAWARGRGPGRWVFLPLLCLASGGVIGGVAAAAVVSQCVLGLAGSLWAACVLAWRHRENPRQTRAFLLLAVGMALYAVIVVCSVLKSPLFSASRLNHELLAAVSSAPVEMLEGLVAVLLTWSLWRYDHVPRQTEGRAPGVRASYTVQLVPALVIVLISGWIVSEHVGRWNKREINQGLITQTRLAAAGVDRDRIKRLTGSSADLGNPDYVFLKEELAVLRRAGSDCLSVYITKRRGREVIFLADSEPADSPDCLPAGRVYMGAPPGLVAMFDSQVPRVEGLRSDRRRSWVSCLVPVRDDGTGGLLGILGMDVDARHYERENHRARLASISVTLLIATLLVVFFAFHRRSQEASWRVAVSEQTYRCLVESSPNCVALFDCEGRYIAINLAGLMALGRTHEGVIGRRFVDFWPEDSRAKVETAVRQVLSGERTTFEGDCPDGLGRTLTWHVVLNPVLAEKSAVKQFVGILVDITERKQREKERLDHLRRIKAQQSASAELVTNPALGSEGFESAAAKVAELATNALRVDRVGVWLLGDGDRTLRCVALFERSSGIQLQNAVLRAEDFPRYFEALQTGRPIDAGDAQEDPRTMEFADDYLIPQRIRAMLDAAIRIGGKIVGVVCHEHMGEPREWFADEIAFAEVIAERLAHLAVDSERRRAEEALRKVSELQTQILRTAATAVFTIDTEQRITDVNAEFSRITGFSAEEVVGKHCNILEGDPCVSRCGLFDSNRQQPIYRRQCELHTKDGRRLTILKNAEVIRDGAGRITGGVESFVDVTELIDARERAEEASRAKGEFLACMSHELRTPLNGVIGMVELLLRSNLDPAQKRYAELAKTSGRSLLMLINDILDITKIEAGKIELERLNFDLPGSIEGVVAMLAPRVIAKGLEPICQIAPDVPARVRGDAARLQQVLMNLIGNAVKFTSAGEIAVRAALKEETDREATIQFRVRDTGIGISPERFDRLFQRFSQVDASTTRKYGGTGLGLAISKRLVELMGGQIGVESEPGRGTSFWFTVRVEKVTESGAEPRAVPENLRGIRVLVVEDNARQREALRQVLTRAEMTSEEAADSEGAMRILNEAASKATPFGVVILEERVSDLDNGRLVRLIGEAPTLKGTKLILLSSKVEEKSDRELRSAGFAACLSKPVGYLQLMDVLARASGASTTERPADKPRSDRSERTARKDSPAATRHALRILLAEDNPISQEATSELLRLAGCVCDVVCNGAEAVNRWMEGDYDLIMMDCQMPEMDGFEATRVIRQQEELRRREGRGTVRIPIVALTASAIQEDRELCLEAGMDEHLTKPVDPERLLRVVERCLAGHEARGGGPRERAPFDPDAMTRQYGGNHALAWKLIKKFLKRLPDELRQLEESLQAEEIDAARRVAHSMKGAAGYMAATGVQEAAMQLEQMCHDQDLSGAVRCLAALRAEVQRCLEYPVPETACDSPVQEGAHRT